MRDETTLKYDGGQISVWILSSKERENGSPRYYGTSTCLAGLNYGGLNGKAPVLGSKTTT